MTSTTESLGTAAAALKSKQFDAGDLVPVLGGRLSLRPEHVVLCLLWVAMFLGFCYLPLPTGGLWRHLAAGEYIVTHHAFAPVGELLPLATGRPVTDSAWLSEVVLFVVYRLGGPAALSTLFALTSVTALSMLGDTFYRQTRRKRFAVAGLVLVVALGQGWITVLRPETFGLVCLAGLLAVLVRDHDWQCVPRDETVGPTSAWLRWLVWIAPPVLLALWANLDRSFVVGAAVLSAWCVGSLIDVARERGLAAVLEEPDCRRRLLVWELSLAATLINPLGLDVWLSALGLRADRLGTVATFGGPLILTSPAGILFACVCLGIAVLLRKSTRSVTAADAILLGGGAAAAVWNTSYLTWFGPLAALVLLPHLASAAGVLPRPATAAEQSDGNDQPAQPRPFQFAYTLVCGLLLWIGFALSPLANWVLGGAPRPLEDLLSHETPLGVSGWLEARGADPDLLWAAPDWSDYLAQLHGVPVMANSALATLPNQVRFDSARLAHGENWQAIANRYALDVIVVDKHRHGRLAAAARRAMAPWRIVYEDDQALVLERGHRASTHRAALAGQEQTS